MKDLIQTIRYGLTHREPVVTPLSWIIVFSAAVLAVSIGLAISKAF